LRYDTPEHSFGKHEAAVALFAAIHARYRQVLIDLRDIPHDEREGIHLVSAKKADRFSQSGQGAGQLIPISNTLISPNVSGLGDTMRRAVIWDEELDAELGGDAPTFCVFVPPATVEWAEHCGLASPLVEASASSLRERWRRDPALADDCVIQFSGLLQRLATEFVTVPSESEWDALGVPAVAPPNPMIESEQEFLRRARDNYHARVRAWYDPEAASGANAVDVPRSSDADSRSVVDAVPVPPFRRRLLIRELLEDATWFAMVQLGQKTPGDIAREQHVIRQTVDHRVRQFAAFIGVTLRRLPKTGRRQGRSETAPRRRETRRRPGE
jgi:hypothetical protein